MVCIAGHAVNAEAQPIGIMLSNTCELTVILDLRICPSYNDLKEYEIKENDIYGSHSEDRMGYRIEPDYNFTLKYWADLKSTLVLTDPPVDMMPVMKTVIIDDVRLVEGEKTDQGNARTKITENLIIWHGCNKATIDHENYKEYLPHAIYHLLTYCVNYNPDNYITITETEITEFEVKDSVEWQRLQELKWLSENCIYEYGACSK